MAQWAMEDEGLEDSDSSFLQKIEMHNSTASLNPIPILPPKQNPLDSVSNVIHSTQLSYDRVSTVSQIMNNERVNHSSHADNKSKNAKCKCINILLAICMSYSVIGVTWLLFITYFANILNINSCQCVYQDLQQIVASESNTTFSPSYFPSISPSILPTTVRPTSSAPTASVLVYNSLSLSWKAKYLQHKHTAHTHSIPTNNQ